MTTTLEDAIDQLNKLYQGKTLYGALFAANTTNQQVSGVDTTTNTFTSNAHNLINGCRVKFSSSNQLPNPLDATTTYLVSSAGNSIVAIDSRNYKPEEDDVIETPSPYFKIKVLFYLQTDKGYDFYIGGDRPTPIKIYSATTYPLNIYLSNLGRGLNDWVIGIHAVSDSDIEAETGLNDYIGHFVDGVHLRPNLVVR